jgi:CHAT domain-containing protein
MKFFPSPDMTRNAFRVVLALVLFLLLVPSALREQSSANQNAFVSQAESNSNASSHISSDTENPFKKTTNIGAEAKFEEANRLRSEQTEASNLRAIATYVDAAYTWRSAGKLHQAAVAFKNAGEVLQLLGNSSSASFHYEEALALARRSSSKEEEAKILNDLGYLQFISGNSKQAQHNSLKALAIGRSLSNREIEAEALSNLGETFYSLGDLEKALEKQQESLSIWRDLGNARGQAISMIALGYCYANLGEPEKALNSYRDGLALAQSAKDLGVEALAHVAFANLKRKFGEKQQALDSYRDAQRIAERIGDKTSLAIVSAGTGTIHFEMGNGRDALEFVERAIRLFEMNDKKWGMAEAKLDLGRIQHSLDNDQEALRNLSDALSLFRSLSMRRLESLTFRAMGQVHRKLGETESALRAYQSALRLTRAGQDQRQEAYTLNYIGELYEDLKQESRALKYYRDALPLSRVSADPISEARTLYNLAHVERDSGNLQDARQHIEAAIEIVESLRTKVSSQDLRTTYFATVRDTYELYIDILMLLHKQSPSSAFCAEAFVVSERARARSFLEMLREGRANVREGVDPKLLTKERELSEAFNMKAHRQMQLLTNKDKKAADEINKELEDLTAQLTQIRDQIKSSSPRYAALTLPQPLNLREVQQRVLNHDSLILEYALGNDRSYVWMVGPDSVAGYELPGRSEIEQSARRLYQLMIAYQMVYGESVDQQSNRRAKAAEAMPAETAMLSRLVLGPLAGKLQNKRLIIIADGALQYIPFQMLTDPDSSQFLLTNHEIVNEPSASTLGLLLSESSERKPTGNSVAVLADPVFEADDPRVKRKGNNVDDSARHEDLKQSLRDIGLSADGVEIPRLLASRDEADAIMNSVPWFTGLKAVGFAANRESVLGPELTKYRVVHFATHGLINNEHPELSGIVLSLFDEQGRSQDGFLRLHDIYNLRLPADLVVLSACSTGLGKDVKGEGLIGLTRGFMYAGASSVVASLWKVDDEATAELMKHFYYAMFRKGLTPVAALRDAQLVMASDQRWQSPYYWAGFVIQGRYDKDVVTDRLMLITLPRVAVAGGLLAVLILTFILIRRRRRG